MVDFIEQVHGIRTQDLVDFGRQGGFSRMLEAKGRQILVKEVPLHTDAQLHDALNEAYMGGVFKNVRYVRGVETFRVTTYPDGSKKAQLFVQKADGQPVTVAKDTDGVIQFGMEMSTKLAEIAANGIVLVDLKPDNLIYDGKEIIIVDLGTSVRRGQKPKGVTYEYSSPDVFDEQGLDSNHDVYCIASMMAEGMLGYTPNMLYQKRAGIINKPVTKIAPVDYEYIRAQLRQQCFPNTKLAEVIAAGLNPDRTKRPTIQLFASWMEELSPHSKTFPTLKSEMINKIQTLEEVGTFLGQLRRSMIPRRADLSPDELKTDDWAQTNFDVLGKIAHALSDPKGFGRGYGSNSANARIDVINNLRSYYSSGTAPMLFLQPDERSRQMTPREKEAVKVALTLHNIADRFPLIKEPLYAANFVNYCLGILFDHKQVSESQNRVAGHWPGINSQIIKGFLEEQKSNP